MNLYGIAVRNTIEEKPIMLGNVEETYTYLTNKGYKHRATATVRGYMNECMSTLHTYKGRYGTGLVRTRTYHHIMKRSTNYMVIEYWIKEN